MKADDAGLAIATTAVALAPLYLLAQLIRAYPNVFRPLALVLLGVALLAVIIRAHQRAVERDADLAERATIEAGRLVSEDLVRETHQPWEARR